MNIHQLVEYTFLPICNIRYHFKPYNRITENNTFTYERIETLNPYTGMDREGWLKSAEYLLNGIFKYVKSIETPMFFPKQKGKSYPGMLNKGMQMTYLEGLSRTLFIAVPLLNENPDLKINGICIAEYYRNQLSNLVNPSTSNYIPDRDVDFPSQPLVEFGGLAISLLLSKKILWDPLTQDIKDKLASKMLSYGEGPYVDNNWKYFCVFILTFLKSEGYKVDENQLDILLQKILDDYSGDGWYLDDSYDYYSMWGYQLYAVIWCLYYGEKHYPEITHCLKRNFKEMFSFFPYLFSRDGKMLMWGRSITYRFGAIAPLLFSSWIDSEDMDHGWYRRISSGTLLQFLENKAFLRHSIPSLGFYGSFEPAIQGYSCRASSFWMGKAYLGLNLPENNLFWSQEENNGPWEKYEKNKCYSYFSDATNIMVTHYPEIGETEIRTCTPRKIANSANYMRNENYNRLSYHSAFPWQADSKNGCVAMNYLIKETGKEWEPLRQYEFISYKEGIFRRRVKLEKYTDTIVDLVDIPLFNGVLRIDRLTTMAVEKEIRLGHYALSERSGGIKESIIHTNHGIGKNLDNGELQLLAVPVFGWKDLITVHNKGIHPESGKSMLINMLSAVSDERILITLLLFKKSGEPWRKEEYEVIEEISETTNEVKIKIINDRLLYWNW